MKHWRENIVKDYFTFTKKERNGIIVLMLLIIAVYLSSRYFKPSSKVDNKDSFQQELASLKISIDSSKNNRDYNVEENFAEYSKPENYNRGNHAKGELFAFDPNTLDEAGWKRLGIREKTISTIQKFRAKGFKFKTPQDLNKVYGLRHEEAQRLIPYIRIAEMKAVSDVPLSKGAVAFTAVPPAPTRRFTIIDINTADTAALISLPGIGDKLARRIVNFREKLGGFHSVDQLSETYGIADSTFQLIKPRLECKNPVVKTLNINTADVNGLRVHPYFKWNIANAIINYRRQHGSYKSVDELRKIDIITDEVFNKIAPYIEV